MTAAQLEPRILARVALRAEPWRLYGPAYDPTRRYERRSRENLFAYIQEVSERLAPFTAQRRR